MTIAARGEPSSLAHSAPDAQAPQALKLNSFEALVALAHEKRDIALKTALERDLRLVRFEDGRMEFSPVEGASSDLAATISKRLYEWTNRRWVVAISSDKGQATLREKAEAAKADPHRIVALFREDNLIRRQRDPGGADDDERARRAVAMDGEVRRPVRLAQQLSPARERHHRRGGGHFGGSGNRSISLSIKAKETAETATALSRMQAENTSAQSGTTNLGALLRAKLDGQGQ